MIANNRTSREEFMDNPINECIAYFLLSIVLSVTGYIFIKIDRREKKSSFNQQIFSFNILLAGLIAFFLFIHCLFKLLSK